MDYQGLPREALVDLLEAQLRDRAEHERVVQELATHQIELEAQNQALRESQGQVEESRSRYADLYDFAPIAYCTFDRNAVVLEINLTGASMLGRERSNIIGRPFRVLARLDAPEALIAHIRAVFEVSIPTIGEISFSTARGPRVVQLVSTPARDLRGPASSCRTAMLDITQQRLAEGDARAVHVSEQGLRRRLERIERASAEVTAALATLSGADLRPFLQVIVDQARMVAEAEYAGLGVGGDAGRRFDPWVWSGMTPVQAEAIGRAPRGVGLLGAVIHTGRPIRLRDMREHAAFSGLPPHHPEMTSFLGVPIRYLGDSRGNLYLANKRDGAEFTEDDQTAIEMFAERVGVALEIARLRQIEARELTRLELLARAGSLLAEPTEYETTLGAVARLLVPVVADLSAVDLVEDDGSVRKVVAYHPDPARQQLVDRLLGTTARDRLPRHFREVIETAEPQLRDASELLHGAMPDADYRKLLADLGVTCTLLAPLVVRGRVVGVLRLAMAESGRRYVPQDLALAREIAHHAALALERARLYRAAQVAIDARDNLLAVVTHDLNNYLATIRMSADVLTSHDVAVERRSGHRQVELIGRTVTHMARLIEGLRDATMIETGQFTVAVAAEQPAALVAEAVETFAPQAEARSLRLTAEVDDELPAVLCDRERVLQVLANLVGNAIKFTPERGDIRVVATRSESAVRISISDTGPGIPGPQLLRIFDRYWKGGEARAGTGLGLYIAKGIVEAHGGRIWVENAAGAGSTFHFTLPVAPAAPDATPRD
ncbi:MAG TPA: ATP-binding protein [Kofleriaceae bacterium]